MTQRAREYGSALFDLAAEVQKTDEYMAQLEVVRSVLQQNPDYLQLLSSHAVAKQKRLAVLDEVFSGRAEPYILNFMKLLCEKDAIGELPLCIRAFELRWFELHGISEVQVTTAVALSDALREKLKSTLEHATGRQIRLFCAVEPELLGGVRLRMDGKELDGTVRARLDGIRAQLAQLTL